MDTKGRAFIAVVHIKNMQTLGLSEAEYMNPEYLANVLSTLWNESGKGRTCAVAVCLSKEKCYHVHLAMYSDNSTTLRQVSKILAHSHVEPQLGGKKELSAYLLKQGKYAEKGEEILYVHNIEAIQDVAQDKRKDVEVIEEMLDKGLTPQQILQTNFRFYRYETMILHAYADQRVKNAPLMQDVYVEWHVGDSGTGKTFYYNQLCKEYGADNIYVLTDYDGNLSSGLDGYLKIGAPNIIFCDEFRGFGISYQKLLTLLTGYSRMQMHARYANTYNLWNKVYITSVYPPEAVYQNMVAKEHSDIDSYEQLLRRITKIVYHYKENGEYKTFSIDAKHYVDYADLRHIAHNSFKPLTEEEQLELPFKD